MKIIVETFARYQTPGNSAFLAALDRSLAGILSALEEVTPQTRIFSDASAAAQTVQLPNGQQFAKDHIIVKVDSSGNTVTILPYGTQTILGTSSMVLATQYDAAVLSFSRTTNDWILL